MKWEALSGTRRFVIEHDSLAGFYLYVFEDGRCTFDHLQDTLEMAMEQATQDFGVQANDWKLIPD